jgi:hypothetical protein
MSIILLWLTHKHADTPVWQGIIIREPGRANSIPPIEAKVWDLEAATSN